MDENISVLKGIGLTMYEAQAYVTLTSLIESTAVEIAEKSNIPRSKIYDVLKGLHKKDFIEIEDGRPLTYIVKSPVDTLSREKEKIDSEIDDTITRLTNIYENEMSQVQAPIWRIYGVEKIIDQEIEIIKRAKNTINMRIGFLFEGEGEALVKAFKNRHNLQINILASPTCYINDEKFEIIEFFKEHDVNIQKADIPFVKVMIADSKEMLHTYTKFSEDKRNVIPETAIGIWNKYEEIAKNYDDRFMNQLQKLKKKQNGKSKGIH
ncbi:MAG: TrmB family transcriptional regulator [Methanobrevibacter sp.]